MSTNATDSQWRSTKKLGGGGMYMCLQKIRTFYKTTKSLSNVTVYWLSNYRKFGISMFSISEYDKKRQKY